MRLPYTISPRSEHLLREVARGIAAGEIFHSGLLRSEEEIGFVFLPIYLMHESQLERLLCADLGLIYEWKARARPGSPDDLLHEFLSCNYLNKADAEWVLAKAKELSGSIVNQPTQHV